jgi:hypothetical protein
MEFITLHTWFNWSILTIYSVYMWKYIVDNQKRQYNWKESRIFTWRKNKKKGKPESCKEKL